MKTDGNTATVAEREAAAAAAGQAELLVLLRKEREARINAEARADEVEAAMRASKDRVAAAEAKVSKLLETVHLRDPTTPPRARPAPVVSADRRAPLPPPPAPAQATFVGHVKGSQYHKPSGSTSWTNLWKQKTGASKLPKCPCCIENPVDLSKNKRSIAGAHVMYRDDNNRLYVGIIPTCDACNRSGNMLRREIAVVTIFDFGAQTFSGKLTTATKTPQKFDVCSKFSVTADSDNVTYEMTGITSGRGRGFANGEAATFDYTSKRNCDDLYYLHLMLADEHFHLERNIRNVRARQGHQEHNFSVFLLGQ